MLEGQKTFDLVVWFDEVEGSEADEQAMVTGGDAVNVITWHRAKGLEWPVVVLDQLHHRERARLWGVTAQSGDARFDRRQRQPANRDADADDANPHER